MDGRWLECCGIPTAAGMDQERAFIQRENLPGISLRVTGRVPGAGSAGDGCQHPPRTVTPGHPVLVSDIQIQSPGSWDVLSQGLLVQARLGSGRAEPRLCSIEQSRRISFPNTSFSPLLMCERPRREGS